MTFEASNVVLEGVLRGEKSMVDVQVRKTPEIVLSKTKKCVGML